MNKEDINFLKELQNEMLTQDHVCQADPRFWVVQGTIQEYGYEYEGADGCAMVIDCDTILDDMKDACEWLNDEDECVEYIYNSKDNNIICHIEDECTIFSNLDEVCEYIVDNLDESPYLVYYRNISKNYENTMFLTNRECKEHIDVNYYHYPKDAHSYAMTAWRSPQVERLYKIIQETDWESL